MANSVFSNNIDNLRTVICNNLSRFTKPLVTVKLLPFGVNLANYTRVKIANYVLTQISNNFTAGKSDSFYMMLYIMEYYGDGTARQLAMHMKQAVDD